MSVKFKRDHSATPALVMSLIGVALCWALVNGLTALLFAVGALIGSIRVETR